MSDAESFETNIKKKKSNWFHAKRRKLHFHKAVGGNKKNFINFVVDAVIH